MRAHRALIASAIALLLYICSGLPDARAAQAPTTATVKQVLTEKLKKLIRDGATERQIVFQDVRAGTANGIEYPFQVTASIRDYGPGYPRNHFYGQTCVVQ